MTAWSGSVFLAGWERVTDPVPGVALLMAARRRPATGVLPSMAVAAVPLPPGGPAAAYLDGLRSELTGGLDGAEVEDEDSFELDGGPVDYLRLSHRDDDRHLVSEVWLWLADGRAWSRLRDRGPPRLRRLVRRLRGGGRHVRPRALHPAA